MADFDKKIVTLVIDASVGASIKTAQTKVRTIRVRLARRPTIGDGACALSVAQRINVGTLASRLFSIGSRGGTSVSPKGTLGQSIKTFGGSAVNVVPKNR